MRAQFAILDITGVSVVDTQVANALVRAAQAVRLLGAQVILTAPKPGDFMVRGGSLPLWRIENGVLSPL